MLRYHLHETLVCKDGCVLVKEPFEYNPMDFIYIPALYP